MVAPQMRRRSEIFNSVHNSDVMNDALYFSGLSIDAILGSVAWMDDNTPCLNCLAYGWTEYGGDGNGLCLNHM